MPHPGVPRTPGFGFLGRHPACFGRERLGILTLDPDRLESHPGPVLSRVGISPPRFLRPLGLRLSSPPAPAESRPVAHPLPDRAQPKLEISPGFPGGENLPPALPAWSSPPY